VIRTIAGSSIADIPSKPSVLSGYAENLVHKAASAPGGLSPLITNMRTTMFVLPYNTKNISLYYALKFVMRYHDIEYIEYTWLQTEIAEFCLSTDKRPSYQGCEAIKSPHTSMIMVLLTMNVEGSDWVNCFDRSPMCDLESRHEAAWGILGCRWKAVLSCATMQRWDSGLEAPTR
jgi:hypothetical protein